jgi:hypothetical protein
MIKLKNKLLITLIVLSVNNAFSLEAHNLASKNGRYEYIKKDSIPENLVVFKKYENSKTRKIIYLCTHGAGRYSVRAQWDLEIVSKQEAQNLAQNDCGEALAGYMLLAYKIKTEHKL